MKLSYWARLSCQITLLALSACSFALLIANGAHLFDVGEVGFGDAWILHAVSEFQRTGVIYPAAQLDGPIPGNVGYGPLLYVVFSIPVRWFPTENPFVGPRLIEILAFIVCVAATTSIARVLIPNRWGWRWAALLALSFASVGPWILQIRGDFLAAACGLIAMRLLFSGTPGAILVAGAVAGLATQFKFVYLAATVAGFIWLAAQRRWMDVVRFTAASLTTSAGIYALFLLREPALPAHIFVLRHPVRDYFGQALILLRVFREPTFLLGAGAALAIAVRPWKRWRLLLIYVVISFLIAAAAGVQAGGDINYFFETFFAVTPFAVMAVLYLRRLQPATAALALAALLATHSVVPAASAAYQSVARARADKNRNRELDDLRSVLQGYRLLSTVPTVTFLSGETVVDEPFLLSYLELLGKLDTRPLAERVRQQEFDLVATEHEASWYRGIPHVSPTLRRDIAQAYEPYCVYRSTLFFLRRNSPSSELAQHLGSIGCARCTAGANCSAW
jgi:hypothetical protein